MAGFRFLPGMRALVAGMLLTGTAVQADTFTIGVVPQFEALRLAEIWTPIVAELEAAPATSSS